MGLCREGFIPLQHPEGEVGLDYFQPYSPLDADKRQADFTAALESLNEYRQNLGSVSELAEWHLIRRGVLAKRTAENLESIANGHGYTVRHLFENPSQAA